MKKTYEIHVSRNLAALQLQRGRGATSGMNFRKFEYVRFIMCRGAIPAQPCFRFVCGDEITFPHNSLRVDLFVLLLKYTDVPFSPSSSHEFDIEE
jgi:hypothetical protein